MFSYFHQHKFLNSNKGQMLPIFILILAVIIIMAMVTINIGKIGFIKTDSSNAADAGALAAGATMSNTFNSIAIANSQMEAGYWEFFAEMSTMFAMGSILIVVAQMSAAAALLSAAAAVSTATAAKVSALLALTIGISPLAVCLAAVPANAAMASMGLAEASASAAAASMGVATGAITGLIGVIIGMMVSVTAFTTAQNFFYLSIRKMAEEGRKNAVRTGHQYLFNNSGITSKLKRNIFKEFDMQNWQQFSNYQQAFAIFMKFIVKEAPFYVYGWIDGQNRAHSVTSNIDIRPVDKFVLKVSVMPYPAEMAILGVVLAYTFAVSTAMGLALAAYGPPAGLVVTYGTALGSYTTGAQAMDRACAKMGCCLLLIPCCIAWIEAWLEAEAALTVGSVSNLIGIAQNIAGIGLNIAALVTIPPLYVFMFAGGGSALAGLLPGPSIVAFGDAMGLLFIIDWIDDIIHDRLVRSSTTQTHGPGNLTLWNTQYPAIQSYSIVNFNDENQGSIHPPIPRHDSSIIWTDIYLPELNPQNDFCPEVVGKVEGLRTQLSNLQASSASLEDNAALLESSGQGARDDTTDLLNQYGSTSTDLRNQAGELQNESDTVQQQIEDISEEMENLPDVLEWLQQILDLIRDVLQKIAEGFSSAISTLLGGADSIDGIGQTLNNRVGPEADAISNSAQQVQEHVQGPQQDEINRLQDEIDGYIQTYPQCFPGEGG